MEQNGESHAKQRVADSFIIKKTHLMTKKVALFALAAILSSFSLMAQSQSKLFVEGNYGAMLLTRNLSVFDKSMTSTHCEAGEFAIAYEVSDSGALGLKLFSSGYETPAFSESVYFGFAGLMARIIRPIHINGEVVLKPFFEGTFGCTFLTDMFDLDDVSYKAKRYGFGMDAVIGVSVPISKYLEISLKCGELISFIGKPKVDVDVPAKHYELGEQMIMSPYIMGTIAINFLGL